MLGTFVNIFKVPDLRNKILFTLALLCLYRIGFHIPVPGFDSGKFSRLLRTDKMILRLGVLRIICRCLPAEL
jgi:preprotein translocase subunit SecY